MRQVLPYLILLVIVASALAVGAGPETATRPAVAPVNWKTYNLVLSRNIFTRDRSSRQRPDGNISAGTQGKNELVLAGVAVQGPEQTAFFEDSASGETSRLTVGQSVGEGMITAIRMEGVDITAGDSTRTIAVGETLSGRRVELKSAPAPSATPAGAAETAGQPGQAGPPDGMMGGEDEPINAATRPSEESPAAAQAPMSIEERMRQRRLQETK
jgi:hypothetical protein